MDPTHLDYILTSYAYGLPFSKLRGTTDPAFLKNPMEWDVRVESCYAVPKALKTVGEHSICSLFASEEPIPPIANTILHIAAKYTSAIIGLDTLRIGYNDDIQPSPVVLIVMVEPEAITWDQGCLLAIEVLRAVHQIDPNLDVHCEVFETVLCEHVSDISRDTASRATVDQTPDLEATPTAALPDTSIATSDATSTTNSDMEPATDSDPSTSLFYPLEEDYNSRFGKEFRYPLLRYTPYLGQPIFAPFGSFKAGSTAIYIRLSKNEESINALLTARHVVCSDESTSDINRLNSTDTTAAIEVFQVPQNYLDEIRVKIRQSIRWHTQRILKQMPMFEEGTLEPRLQLSYLEATNYVTKAKHFMAHVNSSSQIDKRHIGEVIASPPISSVGDKRRDWAVVKLNEHLFGQGSPRNRVYIGGLSRESRYRLEATGSTLLVQGRRTNPLLDQITATEDFVDIKTFFTKENLEGFLLALTDTHKLEYSKDKECLLVYMCGPKTNGTDGVLNNIYSYKWIDGGITREYCVVSTNEYKSFSHKGDGSSVVFAVLEVDMDSNGTTRPTVGVLGYLWGGHNIDVFRQSPNHDISYVTPSDHVKDTFEEFTGWKMSLA